MIDAKAYLQQIKLCDEYISSKLAEVERLKALALNITSTIKGDVSSGSHSQDKIGDAVAKLLDLQNDINNAIDKYVDLKREIHSVLDQLTNKDYVSILYKRYFEHKTWEKIACEMNYSYQWICKLHGRALQAVEKIVKNQN